MAGSFPDSDAMGSDPVSDAARSPLAVKEGTGSPHQKDSVVRAVKGSAAMPRALLVIAVGSRAGKLLSVPRLRKADSNLDRESTVARRDP